MRRIMGALTAGALLVATNAGAVSVGGELYVRARDTRVFEKADLKSKVVATLQPGLVVTWQGADAKVKQIHAISGTAPGGKAFKGFTLQQNLTPNKPQPEIAQSNGAPMDAQAFASSGAATKALSDSALNYAAGSKTDIVELTKGVLTAEAVATSVKTEEAQTWVAKRTGGAK